MTGFNRSDFAGFWKRFIAFVLDIIIVSILVFPFALIIGLASPNAIVVEVPFNLFTTTTTIYENSDENISIETDEVLGLLTNYYEVIVTEDKEGKKSISRNLVEPISYASINKMTSSDIEFYIMFIYWIILESSAWQASLGKKIMGIKVITQNGGKPNIFQCIARNVLKLLSGIILLVGFMMTGWTDKKQALHDKIPNLFLINDSNHQTHLNEPDEASTSA